LKGETVKNNSQKPAPDRRQQAIHATAWFSGVIHATSKEDFQETAEALAELQCLGVMVKKAAFRTQENNT
jgi:hypothetical protein